MWLKIFMEPSHIDWHLERHLSNYYIHVSSLLTNWHRGMAIVFAEDPENTPKVVHPPGASSAFVLEKFSYSVTRLQRNGNTFAQYSTIYLPPWLRYLRSRFLLQSLLTDSSAELLKMTCIPCVLPSDVYYSLNAFGSFEMYNSLVWSESLQCFVCL